MTMKYWLCGAAALILVVNGHWGWAVVVLLILASEE